MKRNQLFATNAGTGVGFLTLTVAAVALLLSPPLALAQLRTIIVESAGDVGQYSSIAVDSHNRAHISYYDAIHRVLKYAMIDNFNVITNVVDNTAGVGTYCAIAVDGADVPHICYYDANNKDLKYAVKRGGAWTVRTVDAVGDVGRFCSITVDQLNNPYIAYYYTGNNYLKLAYVENGGWTIRNLGQATLTDGISGIGRSLVIRLDRVGSNPFILFFDVASSTLKLGMFDRTQNLWGVEDFRNSSVTFQDLAFCLDAANQPHVAFSDVSLTGSETVWYGKKTCLGSGCITQVSTTQPTGVGTWNFEQVDAAAGNSVSLALDGTTGLPWVSYCDPVSGLMLARKIGTAWSVQTVDPGWEVGLYSSLALDRSNNPHISYYDQTNGDLKYAGILVPPAIDVWIKDCAQDNGKVPSTPNCPEWRFSPDIFVDNNGDGIPDLPRRGVPNTLKAQVRNRGFLIAANVAVKFYASDLRSVSPATIGSSVTFIGQSVVTVRPNRTVIASIQWTPPVGTPPGGNWVGVVLSHPADRPRWPLVPPAGNNNVAVHCFLPGQP